MPALPSSILEPLWVQVAALLPPRQDTHPLGCHLAAATAASPITPARRPRCGDAATSGSAPASLTNCTASR